jgi:hypothetical protein
MKSELSFEYCALRFLLQWLQRERALHDRVAGNPSLQQVRSALQYFQVARTFEGLRSDKAAEAVAKALRQVDRNSQLSPEEKVMTLASRFKESFNRFNLAAASKLLWLKHRWPYIIYDSRAVNALRGLGCKFQTANYTEYCKCWRNEYGGCQKQIKQAGSRLHVVRAFLPSSFAKKAELMALASQPWFLERVFDIYLWETGGAVTNRYTHPANQASGKHDRPSHI